MGKYSAIMKAVPSEGTTFKKHWMKQERVQDVTFVSFLIVAACSCLVLFIHLYSFAPFKPAYVDILCLKFATMLLVEFCIAIPFVIAFWCISYLPRLLSTWRSINTESKLKLRRQELTRLLESKTKRLDYRQAVVEEQHPTKYTRLLEVGRLPANAHVEVDELMQIEKSLGIERQN